jgi:hypothetical protein
VFALTAGGRKLFSKVGPDSEALYADMEREFGNEKLKLLYDLLADFYQTLSTENDKTVSRSATG